MKKILFGLTVLLAVTAIIYRSNPAIFLGSAPLTAPVAWSLIGTLLSFLGLIFSFYALLEVKKLSHRYFAKQRLPELESQIGAILTKMRELEPNNLKEFRASGTVGEIRVLIKQLKKTKSPGFVEVVKRTETYRTSLESELKANSDKKVLLNSLDSYWELSNSLSEITDEIKAYNAESRAIL